MRVQQSNEPALRDFNSYELPVQFKDFSALDAWVVIFRNAVSRSCRRPLKKHYKSTQCLFGLTIPTSELDSYTAILIRRFHTHRQAIVYVLHSPHDWR